MAGRAGTLSEPFKSGVRSPQRRQESCECRPLLNDMGASTSCSSTTPREAHSYIHADAENLIAGWIFRQATCLVPASLEASWLIECRGSVKVVVGPRNQINKDKHKKPPVIKDQAAFLTANADIECTPMLAGPIVQAMYIIAVAVVPRRTCPSVAPYSCGMHDAAPS